MYSTETMRNGLPTRTRVAQPPVMLRSQSSVRVGYVTFEEDGSYSIANSAAYELEARMRDAQAPIRPKELLAPGSSIVRSLVWSSVDIAFIDARNAPVAALLCCEQLAASEVTMPVILLLSCSNLEVFASSGVLVDFVLEHASGAEINARVLRAVASAFTHSDAQSPPPHGPETLDGLDACFFDDQNSTILIDPDTAVALTPTEYQVAKLLCSQPRKVFSRDSLLEAIWEPAQGRQLRTVDVCISRLRRKFGNRACQIETVWSVGYRFDPSKGPDRRGAPTHSRHAA